MPKSRRAGPVSDTHRRAPAEQTKHRRNFSSGTQDQKKKKINTRTGGVENEPTQNTLHTEQRKSLGP
jgi:hypothetical protein